MLNILKTTIAALALTVGLAACAASEAEDIPNERQVSEDLIVGGQPTIEGLENAAAEGVEVVISFRGPDEFDDFNEQQIVEDLGMTWVNIPITSETGGYSAENIEKLHNALDGVDGKVLAHCTVGWRASTMLALNQWANHGMSAEDAVDYAENAHMDHVRETVENAIEALENSERE